ncbi:MAG: UbiA family prenyltransferase [Methanotrichaceae archaeon]|nr:UbiA family prenyltransferase [Methanotrichaceae archaeon]
MENCAGTININKGKYVLDSFLEYLKNLFILLAVSSIFVGFTGFFQTYVGYILLGAEPNHFICFSVFLMTFSVYSLNKLSDADEDAINTPERARFLQGKKRSMYVVALAAYIFSALIALIIAPLTILVVLIPIGANAVYSSRLIPGIPRLKDIPVMKNVVVAVSWASVCTLMPFMSSGTMEVPLFMIVLVGYFMIVRVFINTVIFDIRDIEGDRTNGIRTIPVFLGLPKTTVLLLAVNSTLLPWLWYYDSARLMSAIMAVYGYLIILCFRKKRNSLALDLFVDGEWMIACIVFAMVTGIWAGI